MQSANFENHVKQLSRRFEQARPTERLNFRPEVRRLIEGLRSRNQPVPVDLRRIDTRLEQEAFDDMFDNMPV